MVTRSPTRTMRTTQPAKAVKSHALDAALIEGFQRHYLWDSFDGPAGTAPFHRVMWEEACDETKKRCAWAAPRGHSKSTSITTTFVLAAIVFRMRDHIMIVSDSYDQAVHQLKEIKDPFYENEELRQDFKFRQFLKDTENEIILEFADGHVVRVIAKGSEQRLRGLKWRQKRPNMIIGDDLEFDEIVMNAERRTKFVNWFFKQMLPAGSRDCLIRIVGTILHFDSLLMNLMGDPKWTTHLWSAHHSFEDFSEILWPERWTEEMLREERDVMVSQGKADAYSQEYLNQPIAEGNTFFDPDDLVEIPDYLIRDWEFDSPRTVTFYGSIDLAVSTKQRADFAVITVATLDAQGYLDVVDVRKGRFGPEALVEEWFKVHEEYEIDTYLVEQGAIQKSIMPYLNTEMARRNAYLNLHMMVPSVDKMTRAQSIRARMRGKRVRFDKAADWYPGVEQELLHFPRGKHDDVVDTLSQFGLALEELITPPSEDELDEEEWQREEKEANQTGRNAVTGY